MHAVSLRVLAVATLVVAASCDRGVTAPAPSSAPANELIILGSPRTVSVVQRNTALASPLTASATVGFLGGQINMPGAGLKVIIPPFAVMSPTTITVTALAGRHVAYEFQPHGTRFFVPLLVTQNLTATNAVSGGLLSPGLFAGYFANASDLDPLGVQGLVSEVLGVALNLSNKTATFPVFHFSGWLIATGRDSSSESEGGSSRKVRSR